MADKKIVFATGNTGKMREIREILADLDLEVVSMKEIGFNMPIEENGTTFEENALIKARAVAGQCGEIVLADDSGLEVDYLNGDPGIYSARYMGEETPYSIKMRLLLNVWQGYRMRKGRPGSYVPLQLFFRTGRNWSPWGKSKAG